MKRAWLVVLMIVLVRLINGAEEDGCTGELTIREYNLAHVSTWALHTAHQEACRLFRDAGVVIRWEAGDPKDKTVTVLDQSAANVLHPEPAHPESINMEIVSDRQTPLPRGALGLSFPHSRHGAQVIISSDRIDRIGAPLCTSPATALGYVMAHEIAHVLLQSLTHSKSGIMQANWNKPIYYQIQAGMLAFNRADAAALRVAAQKRQELSCPTLYSKYPDE